MGGPFLMNKPVGSILLLEPGGIYYITISSAHPDGRYAAFYVFGLDVSKEVSVWVKSNPVLKEEDEEDYFDRAREKFFTQIDGFTTKLYPSNYPDAEWIEEESVFDDAAIKLSSDAFVSKPFLWGEDYGVAFTGPFGDNRYYALILHPEEGSREKALQLAEWVSSNPVGDRWYPTYVSDAFNGTTGISIVDWFEVQASAPNFSWLAVFDDADIKLSGKKDFPDFSQLRKGDQWSFVDPGGAHGVDFEVAHIEERDAPEPHRVVVTRTDWIKDLLAPTMTTFSLHEKSYARMKADEFYSFGPSEVLFDDADIKLSKGSETAPDPKTMNPGDTWDEFGIGTATFVRYNEKGNSITYRAAEEEGKADLWSIGWWGWEDKWKQRKFRDYVPVQDAFNEEHLKLSLQLDPYEARGFHDLDITTLEGDALELAWLVHQELEEDSEIEWYPSTGTANFSYDGAGGLKAVLDAMQEASVEQGIQPLAVGGFVRDFLWQRLEEGKAIEKVSVVEPPNAGLLLGSIFQQPSGKSYSVLYDRLGKYYYWMTVSTEESAQKLSRWVKKNPFVPPEATAYRERAQKELDISSIRWDNFDPSALPKGVWIEEKEEEPVFDDEDLKLSESNVPAMELLEQGDKWRWDINDLSPNDKANLALKEGEHLFFAFSYVDTESSEVVGILLPKPYGIRMSFDNYRKKWETGAFFGLERRKEEPVFDEEFLKLSSVEPLSAEEWASKFDTLKQLDTKDGLSAIKSLFKEDNFNRLQKEHVEQLLDYIVEFHEVIKDKQKELASPFADLPPSEVDGCNWLYHCVDNDYPAPTRSSGKWVVWVAREEMDAVWEDIKTALEEGRLGREAKIKAGKFDPHEVSHIPICIYTYSYADSEDTDRIREELRELGFTDNLRYGFDENCVRGRRDNDYLEGREEEWEILGLEKRDALDFSVAEDLFKLSVPRTGSNPPGVGNGASNGNKSLRAAAVARMGPFESSYRVDLGGLSEEVEGPLEIEVKTPNSPHIVKAQGEGSDAAGLLEQELERLGLPVDLFHLDYAGRDYTVNALYLDPSTGEIFDPGGQGLQDLEQGILRSCIDPQISMYLNPLNILRGMRRALMGPCDPVADVEDAWVQQSPCLDEVREMYRAIAYGRLFDADPTGADQMISSYGLEPYVGTSERVPPFDSISVGDLWQDDDSNSWEVLALAPEQVKVLVGEGPEMELSEEEFDNRRGSWSYYIPVVSEMPQFWDVEPGDTWKFKEAAWKEENSHSFTVLDKIGSRLRVIMSKPASEGSEQYGVYGPSFYSRLARDGRFFGFEKGAGMVRQAERKGNFRDVDITVLEGSPEKLAASLHGELGKLGSVTPLGVSRANGSHYFSYDGPGGVKRAFAALNYAAEETFSKPYVVGGFVRDLLCLEKSV